MAGYGGSYAITDWSSVASFAGTNLKLYIILNAKREFLYNGKSYLEIAEMFKDNPQVKGYTINEPDTPSGGMGASEVNSWATKIKTIDPDAEVVVLFAGLTGNTQPKNNHPPGMTDGWLKALSKVDAIGTDPYVLLDDTYTDANEGARLESYVSYTLNKAVAYNKKALIVLQAHTVGGRPRPPTADEEYAMIYRTLSVLKQSSYPPTREFMLNYFRFPLIPQELLEVIHDTDSNWFKAQLPVNQPPAIKQFLMVEAPSARLQNRDLSFLLEVCDPDGGALAARLDYGDGTADDFAITGCQTVGRVHKFSQSGAFKVVLTIKDNKETVRSELDFMVLADQGLPPPNTPPVIKKFQLATNSAQIAGSPAMFEVDVCDPDSDAVVLDFNYGDGHLDSGIPQACGTGLRTHTYVNPGNFRAALTATDSRQGRAGAVTSVTIGSAPPPVINSRPTAVITTISPNPALKSQTISFMGSGVDPDGAITDYEWATNNTVVSIQTSFTKSDLAVGSYTISFRVKDNLGLWSSEVTAQLEVKGCPTLPSQTQAGRDLDGNGLCEDATGNSTFGFSDLILLFKNMAYIQAQNLDRFFDCSKNSVFDFTDLGCFFKDL